MQSRGHSRIWEEEEEEEGGGGGRGEEGGGGGRGEEGGGGGRGEQDKIVYESMRVTVTENRGHGYMELCMCIH